MVASCNRLPAGAIPALKASAILLPPACLDLRFSAAEKPASVKPSVLAVVSPMGILAFGTSGTPPSTLAENKPIKILQVDESGMSYR